VNGKGKTASAPVGTGTGGKQGSWCRSLSRCFSRPLPSLPRSSLTWGPSVRALGELMDDHPQPPHGHGRPCLPPAPFATSALAFMEGSRGRILLRVGLPQQSSFPREAGDRNPFSVLNLSQEFYDAVFFAITGLVSPTALRRGHSRVGKPFDSSSSPKYSPVWTSMEDHFIRSLVRDAVAAPQGYSRLRLLDSGISIAVDGHDRPPRQGGKAYQCSDRRAGGAGGSDASPDRTQILFTFVSASSARTGVVSPRTVDPFPYRVDRLANRFLRTGFLPSVRGIPERSGHPPRGGRPRMKQPDRNGGSRR